MIKQTPLIWERHPELWPRPVQAVLHVAQVIAESLVFGNLGVDVVTTPFQAVILVLGLASIWSWSVAGDQGGINPLEAAGATIVDRELPSGVYLPGQPGVQHFAAGGLVQRDPAGRRRRSSRPAGGPDCGRLIRPMTRRGALAVSALVVTMALMQAPRVERYFIAKMPPRRRTARFGGRRSSAERHASLNCSCTF